MSSVSDCLKPCSFDTQFDTKNGSKINENAFKSNYEFFKKICIDEIDRSEKLVSLNQRKNSPELSKKVNIEQSSNFNENSVLFAGCENAEISCKRKMNKISRLFLINCGEDSILMWSHELG